jgi:hypothetical protein
MPDLLLIAQRRNRSEGAVMKLRNQGTGKKTVRKTHSESRDFLVTIFDRLSADQQATLKKLSYKGAKIK